MMQCVGARLAARHAAAGPARALPRRPVRGLSTVLVIAVLATLGALTVHAVGLVNAAIGDDSRALDHRRATQAAAAGVEWGRYRAAIPALPVCAAAQTLAGLPATLGNHTVTVRCTVNGPFVEGATTLRRYRIEATACNQPAAGACPKGC